MDQSGICVCHVQMPDVDEYLVTLLPPEVMSRYGLIPEAVIGKLTEPLTSHMEITPDRLIPNRRFIDFMHEIIARFAPEQAEFRGEAENRKKGCIVLVDARTPTPNDFVPPEDILGVFEIVDGKASAATYHPWPQHRLVTEIGFFKLPGELHALLIAELRRRSEAA